jgi:hypothetical protein
MRQRVVKTFSSVPSLRPGLFYDLSTGDSCPLRIPPTSRISATGINPWVSMAKIHMGVPHGHACAIFKALNSY